MTVFNPFSYFLLIHFCDQAAAMVYHITPPESDLYHIQPCLTLSKFAANFSNQFDPNTTLIVPPGNHSLYVNISVSNVNRFVMEPENKTPSITCENHVLTFVI